MKRRSFLVGLGCLTSAAGVITGSGAFSATTVDRSVSARVVADHSAYLKLTQRGSGRRSYTDHTPSQVAFEFPGADDDDYGGTNPEGLGANSVYRFGRDAAGKTGGLFAIENQNSQSIRVYSSPRSGPSEPSVTIFDVETNNLLTAENKSSPLDSGEAIQCGLEIDTRGVTMQDEEFSVTVEIKAEVVEK